MEKYTTENLALSDSNPHRVLTEANLYKWVALLNQKLLVSSAAWAHEVLSPLCSLIRAKAALCYIYQEKTLKYNLIYTYPDTLIYELEPHIKLPESALMKMSDLRISQSSVDENSSFYTSVSSDTPILLIPIAQGAKISAYFEIVIPQTLQQDDLDFMHQLMPFWAVSLEGILEKEQLRKKVRELESINKAMEASQEAMHENAVKFMRIHQKLTASINYAQKMQKAILPPEELLASSFEEVFIIYEPKDIVSGDFYWFSQIEYTFLAVIDCTGHGVPGAFMSMIGNTLLNEIVNSKRVYDPARILEMLHEGVRSALNQNQSQNIDGMELCLCRFTRDEQFNMILTYAGAKRPLYYVRNKNLYKIPGTRRSIGGVALTDPPDFENYTVQLEEGDVLFLSTDGLKDAPNHKRKSLGIHTLKKLMVENAHLPLVQFKALVMDLLARHQEGAANRDDITLIGIKV